MHWISRSLLRPEAVKVTAAERELKSLGNFDMPFDFKRNYFESNLARSSAIP